MRSDTSNSILIQDERWTISPLMRQSFLLSSSTVLRFSIQAGSAGPSKMIHFLSWLVRICHENKRMRLDVILVSAPGGGCHVPEGGGEHPVTPLVGRRVETPVKLRHGDRLGVNNGGDHLKRREENMLENYII